MDKKKNIIDIINNNENKSYALNKIISIIGSNIYIIYNNLLIEFKTNLEVNENNLQITHVYKFNSNEIISHI